VKLLKDLQILGAIGITLFFVLKKEKPFLSKQAFLLLFGIII